MPRLAKLKWKNATIKLSELEAWEHNPRLIKEKEAHRLLESLDEFGQIQTLACGPKNGNGKYPLYDGHQRKLVWGLAEKFGEDLTVDVRISNRPLTARERKKLPIILHRGATGEPDWDLIANEYDVDELLEWGYTPYELFGKGFDIETDLDYDDEWQGMPDYDNPDDPAGFKTIIVHFENQDAVDLFAEVVDQTITDKTKGIWFPEKERQNVKELVYADES